MRVWLIGTVVMAAWIMVLVVLTNDYPLASSLGSMAIVAAVAMPFVLGATARIEGVGGRLLLVNMWTTTSVPARVIARVEADNGVEVVTAGGERYSSTAYQGSAIELFYRSRRYQRVAERVRAWVGAARRDEAGAPVVVQTLRRAVPVVVVVSLVGSMALGSLAFVLRPELQAPARALVVWTYALG